MSNRNLLIILLIFFCSKLLSEEGKKIIVLEDNLELEKIDATKGDNEIESKVKLKKETNDLNSEKQIA